MIFAKIKTSLIGLTSVDRASLSLWRIQILAILRIELSKNFWGRRAMLLYLLALVPVVILFLLAIVDPDGPDGKPIALFESGAILVYLASKVNRFLGETDREKFTVLQWLMWQMGGFGPMLGQAHHFRIYAPEKIDYAYNRYTNEAKRLYGVMNQQVSMHPYIAGKQYSIADIAIFPWLRSWKNQGIDWADFPRLKDWFDRVGQRPAVIKGCEVLADLRKPLQDDKKAMETLFGKAQYEKR